MLPCKAELDCLQEIDDHISVLSESVHDLSIVVAYQNQPLYFFILVLILLFVLVLITVIIATFLCKRDRVQHSERAVDLQSLVVD